MAGQDFDPDAIRASVAAMRATLDAKMQELRPGALQTYTEIVNRKFRGQKQRGDAKRLADARYILKHSGGIPRPETVITQFAAGLADGEREG